MVSLMLPIDKNLGPRSVLDVRVNLHAEVLGQRATHGAGLFRGYCGFPEDAVSARIARTSQKANAPDCGMHEG